MNAETFFRFALDAGRRAAALCARVQREDVVQRQEKAGREPVTVADYASQAVLLHALARAFPDHGVLSEESAGRLRTEAEGAVARRVVELVRAALGDDAIDEDAIFAAIDHEGDPGARYRWAIDPIDGTKGFLRGDQYAIALGVLERGRPLCGALMCPNFPASDNGRPGTAFLAFRGAGAFEVPLDGERRRPVRASAVSDPAGVRVLGSVESSHGDPALLTRLVAELGFGGGVVRLDSQVKYAALARGDAEVYLRPRSKPDWRDNVWDHVAGVALLEEAGGKVTDTLGAPLDFSHGAKLEANVGVLATNGPLHDEIVEALRPWIEGGV